MSMDPDSQQQAGASPGVVVRRSSSRYAVSVVRKLGLAWVPAILRLCKSAKSSDCFNAMVGIWSRQEGVIGNSSTRAGLVASLFPENPATIWRRVL